MNDKNALLVDAGKATPARAALSLALAQTLGELGSVLREISTDRYCRPMGDAFRSAAIGGHVRHVLDHVAPIVDLGATRRINYDQRKRGTTVERDPAAAAAELDRIIMLVDRAELLPIGSIEVQVLAGADGPEVATISSVDRELAFALSHTIHHCSTLRLMMHQLGIAVPETFGYAPSTLSHQRAGATVKREGSASCVR